MALDSAKLGSNGVFSFSGKRPESPEFYRLRLANQIYEELKGHFGNLVFNTVIQRNIRLSEAPRHGLPAVLYDCESRGSVNHMELAKELIMKNR